MRGYTLRRSKDGRWEAILEGSSIPLFVFDNEEDVGTFVQTMGSARAEPFDDASQPEERRPSALAV